MLLQKEQQAPFQRSCYLWELILSLLTRPETTTDLPDPGQITQVEDVVELGGSGQHLDLDLLPQVSSCRHQALHQLYHLIRETAFLQKQTKHFLTGNINLDLAVHSYTLLQLCG